MRQVAKQISEGSLNPQERESFLNQGALIGAPDDSHCLVVWGDLHWSTQPDSVSLYAPNYLMTSQKSWLNGVNWRWIEKKELDAFAHEVLGTRELDPLNWVEPDFHDFDTLFTRVQTAFTETTLQKAVPVVFAHCEQPLDFSHRVQSLRHLARSKLSRWIYGYWTSDQGLLGATPELLFSRNGLKLQTMALAGTASQKGLLLNDPKEWTEHQLVVEDLRSLLGPLGYLQVSETFEWDVGSLVHLRTDLNLDLKEEWPDETLVKKLHPTPALGVFPRELKENWWHQLSLEDRRHFGAPFGLRVKNQGAEMIVAIRGIQWDSRGIQLGSGCGVVKDSRLEKEWQELSLKRQSVRKALGL